jgi:hypothetical protein
MYGITEIEVFKEKNKWKFRIVSGKNNTPRCVSSKSYKSGDLAYTAAERFAKLLKEIDTSPRFFNLPQ